MRVRIIARPCRCVRGGTRPARRCGATFPARSRATPRCTSPAAVPLDDFELIYTEGDSNNTRSIRVRYNAMLAQAAYDGAAPRAMAVEDLPNPTPVHVFLRG